MIDKEYIINLIKEANSNLKKSYSPYSNFPVSAIVVDNYDKKYYGVNIENASYGLSVCAERNAISSAVFNGVTVIKYIIITAKNVNVPISPCGMCRQVIREFSNEKTLVILANYNNYEYKVYSIYDLLPYSFTNKDL